MVKVVVIVERTRRGFKMRELVAWKKDVNESAAYVKLESICYPIRIGVQQPLLDSR
jgi:hypothetical protein